MEMKNIIRVGLVVGGILLLALLGNFTVEGWQWGIEDFIVMGVLLFGTGLALLYVISHVRQPVYRALLCMTIVILLLAIWAELAVDAVSQLVMRLNFWQ